MGKHLGLSKATIVRYENGQTKPEFETAEKYFLRLVQLLRPWDDANAIFQSFYPGRTLPRNGEHLDQTLRITDNTSNGTAISVELFSDIRESNYYHELGSANELWTSGLNLRRILDEHEAILEQILDRNASRVRVLLLDKAQKQYGTIQENGVDSDEEEYAATIDTAATKLRNLSKGRSGRLQVRFVNFPIQAGLDLINPRSDAEHNPNWIAYIRFYQIRKCRIEDIDDDTRKRTFGTYEDQPIMRLTSANPAHKELFLYYKRQFTTLWREKALSATHPVGVKLSKGPHRRPRLRTGKR